MSIVPLTDDHHSMVLAIYGEGIEMGDATFESDVPDWSSWDAEHLDHSRLVAVHDDQILGWAALSGVSGRCVYAGVAEVSVYVAASARGQGIGSALLSALVESSEAHGIWTLQAGIFPENEASLAIHTKAGFRQVGIHERLGEHHGRWRDVVRLERRSASIG